MAIDAWIRCPHFDRWRSEPERRDRGARRSPAHQDESPSHRDESPSHRDESPTSQDEAGYATVLKAEHRQDD